MKTNAREEVKAKPGRKPWVVKVVTTKVGERAARQLAELTADMMNTDESATQTDAVVRAIDDSYNRRIAK